MDIPVPLLAGIATAAAGLIAIVIAISKLAQKIGKIESIERKCDQRHTAYLDTRLRRERPHRTHQRQGGSPYGRPARPAAPSRRRSIAPAVRRSIPPAPADTLAGAPLGPLEEGRRTSQPGGVATAGATLLHSPSSAADSPPQTRG